MKAATILFLALVAIAAPGLARDEYIITKISPSLVPTPEHGGGRRHAGDSKWLQVETDFKSNVDLTDELTFNYYLLYAGKCLVGEVTYVNVFKERELHSVMYISPRSLKILNDGRMVSLNQLENITVQIVSKGQVVAERSMRESRGEWWKTLEPVKGIVLKKNQTPFTWVDWDYFEEIKPETAK